LDEDGWIAAVRLDELPDRKPVQTRVGDAEILIVRNGEELFAIGNRCTHQQAPLHRGPVKFSGSLRTVRCALHGSTFDLANGRVIQGPATRPEPSYETRVVDGVVEIRDREHPAGDPGV
jgi:nitrite reductase/ring-hydroxylating ferredoxin subunit